MGLLSSIGSIFGIGNNKTATAPKPASSSVFSSPFFSLKGQSERLGNIAGTLTSVFTGKGVSVSPKAKSVLGETTSNIIEKVASHPFVSAGVATGGITAARIVMGKGAIGAKVSGILNSNKPTPKTIPDSSRSTDQAAVATILEKQDQKNAIQSYIAAAGSDISKIEDATISSPTTKKYRKKTKRHKKKKRSRRIKRHKKRKLKFGSPAWRKKYLHKKHKKKKKR